MTTEATTTVAALMRLRVDAVADARELRRPHPLGAGYYPALVRERAAALAAAWCDLAAVEGITLADLDDCANLAIEALDAVQHAHRHGTLTLA